MSALTSLLVRDRVVSVSKIEEALHSQVFLGGDIEIILLEMGVVAEDVLSAYRAALFDLLPATREEVMKARDALRRVPAEMARALGIVPIFFEGRSLVVAAWEPLYEPRLREVEAQLGWEVSVRIVNQARLASALAHHYGFELEPRLRRLSDSLRRRDPGVVPYVRPPTDSMRPIARVERVADSDEAEEDGDEVTAVSIPPLPPPPRVMSEPAPAAPLASSDDVPANDEAFFEPSSLGLDEEPLAASDRADEPEAASAAFVRPTTDSSYESAFASAEDGLLASAPELEPEQLEQTVVTAHTSLAASSEAQDLVAIELREEDEEEAGEGLPRGVSSQLGALVRGPVSLARAVELLQVTGQRDDVLFVLLRYVQQFFDFVCVFSVGKDGVRARMAHGAGLPRDLVEHVFIPSPSAGLMADVIRGKRAQLGYLGSSPEEHPAATLLHRELGRPGLAVPLDLNQRVVLIVYADRVGAGLGIEHASAIQAVVPAVTSALRRIILDAKTQRRDSLPPSSQVPSLQAATAEVAPPTSEPASSASEPASSASEPASSASEPASSASDQRLLEASEPFVASTVDAQVVSNVSETRLSLAERATAHLRGDADREEEHLERELAPHQLDGLDAHDADAGLGTSQSELDAVLDGLDSDETDLSSFGPELSAVDLDAFERLIRDEPASDLHVITPASRDPREGALVRERIAGVPRTAPPPPLFEPAAPPQATNAYRYRGGAGLAQERVRVEHASASASAAQPQANAHSAIARSRAEDPRASTEATREDGKTERSRLSLVEPAVNEPSVIIDMGESVEVLVAALLKAPPGSEPREIDELLTIGESALPVLMQHFPGPLWFDRARAHRRRPRGRDVSAVARAVTEFGERAAPYLASLLAGGDPERSYYALLVAGEIVHADLLDPVARRVLDRDDSLRALALEVLRSYAVLPQYDVVVRAISDLTERPGKDPRRQRLAVEALGALRDSRTLRTLLARLSDRDEQVVHAAHDALVVLTGQDFGFSARKWESWVEGWGRAHRVEWLIESLLHSDENVRTTAGEELKLLTQQYFGYHPSLSKRERELSQRKYREWWEFEGRLSFGR